MAPQNISDRVTETTPLLQDQTDIVAVPADTTHLENGAIETTNGSARRTQRPVTAEVQGSLKYIVPAISLGVFLAALDQTIIVASYGKIGSDLKALNLTSWIATSYFLTLTSFQPLYGRLSDIFGRKACLIFAYVVFGLGGLFCGLSQNIYQLIAARIFQGIGGGGMTTVVSILMSDLVPLRDRGLWQGIINIVYATGSGVGAPLGGIMADYVGWRWSFLFQTPICAAAVIAVSCQLTQARKEQTHLWANIKRIDFLGAIILVGAVLGLLVGLDRGSNVSWSLPLTIISLSVSGALFITFVLVEVYVAQEPFAPGHIIFDRSLFACYLCNFFSFGGWLAALYFLPLFFQAADGISATKASLLLIPCITTGVTGSLFGGWAMRYTGKYYWLTVIAYGLLTSAMTVVFLFSGIITTSTAVIVVATTMCAFGNGIGVTTTLIGLISNATPEDQAIVTACSYLFRSLGSVVGLSLSATVIQQTLRDQLRNALRDSRNIDEIVQGVRRSLEFIRTLEPRVQHIVRNCYGSSINLGFAFMISFVFFSFFFSIFIREKKLTR